MEGLKDTVVVLDGKRYEVVSIETPYDVSEEFGSESYIEHVIKGFDEDLFIVEQIEENGDMGILYGYAVNETDTGMLLVLLQDDVVRDKAFEILAQALNAEIHYD